MMIMMSVTLESRTNGTETRGECGIDRPRPRFAGKADPLPHDKVETRIYRKTLPQYHNDHHRAQSLDPV